MKPPSIFIDIEKYGYVIFSNKKAKLLQNYYPTVSNKYPIVSIEKLKIYDLVTIKVFVTRGGGTDIPTIVDDYVDLTVESVDIGADVIVAKVISPLPEDFVFKTGASIELREEEILYSVPVGNYLKDTGDFS